MNLKNCYLAAFAALGLSLAGCAGDDTGDTDSTTNDSATTSTSGSTSGSTGTETTGGTDTTGDTDTTGTDTTGTGEVTYADVQAIWDNRCVAGCHMPGGSKADLSLESAVSYDNIVSKQSAQVTLNIVEPGSTDQSYLWNKLNNTQLDVGGSGAQMPLGQSLPADELAVVEKWITDGANM
ncbi:MAG: hypothetical protein KC486_17430 [Myxococcales bacterium]|nr:hypothetical protein [Myxococcales bacterium]